MARLPRELGVLETPKKTTPEQAQLIVNMDIARQAVQADIGKWRMTSFALSGLLLLLAYSKWGRR
jgi:hypothetical protein